MRNMLAARDWTAVDALPGKGAPVEQSHRHVPHPLYRFLRCLRAETPEGSLPAGAEEHGASRRNPSPPHDKAACACSLLLSPHPSRLALRLPFPAGSTTGVPRSVSVPTWGRSGLSAGGRPLRPVTLAHRFLTPDLLVQASQHFPLVSQHDGCRPCTCVDLPMPSSLPTTSVLVVATSAHALVTTLADEAPLSQQLRTPPFPVTHVLGGYCWQNNR